MGYPVGANLGAAASKLPKLNKWDESHDAIINGLKAMYASKVCTYGHRCPHADLSISCIHAIAVCAFFWMQVRPLEAAYRFENFFSPLLNDSDFEAKPMVLLLGQYSVGKTSFIKFLLERDFPGSAQRSLFESVISRDALVRMQ